MPELKGHITHILDPETGEGKNGTWIKQSFVVTYGEETERSAAFSLFGEKKVALIEKLGEGDYVHVNFHINSTTGRSESTSNKWFTELNAWKIEVISKAYRPAAPAASQPPAPAAQPAPVAETKTTAPAVTTETGKPKASAAAQPSASFETAEDDSLPF